MSRPRNSIFNFSDFTDVAGMFYKQIYGEMKISTVAFLARLFRSNAISKFRVNLHVVSLVSNS